MALMPTQRLWKTNYRRVWRYKTMNSNDVKKCQNDVKKGQEDSTLRKLSLKDLQRVRGGIAGDFFSGAYMKHLTVDSV
jgi:hypothetical protein